jgi:isopenicillin N synthase-like dioxygenase
VADVVNNGTGARQITEHEVPIIDIGSLRDGSDPMTVAEQLGWAATDVGFIYVRNHGVPRVVVEQARAAALRFFNRPLADKLEVTSNLHHHGYLGPGQTKMYDEAAVDLKESFNWGIELCEEELADETRNPLLGPNLWPGFLPELKQVVYPYFEAAQACAVDLLRGFALAAKLPEDAFVKRSDRPISRGSLQYYPPQATDLEQPRFGLAPHTDFGVLTVLCQDAIGGLQIQDLAGQWLAVPPVEDTLVVNVGDLLERWTNGHFRSTPHRVINTSGRERLSLVVAYDPNFESVVDPSVLCAEDEVPRHEPISCGDYLMWRFKKAFAYRQ